MSKINLNRIKILLLFFIPFLYSCQKKVENEITVNNNSIESFNLFFKKFSSNQNFQEERIKFPLKTYSYDIDENKTNVSILNKNQWEFSKLYSNKFLKKIKKINSKNYIVVIQISDTGVLVEYYFTIDKYKWYLIKIVDQST